MTGRIAGIHGIPLPERKEKQSCGNMAGKSTTPDNVRSLSVRGASHKETRNTPIGKLTQIQQARLFSHGKAGGGPPVRGRLP